MRHPGLRADVQRERLLARARGRVLDIGQEKGWATNTDLELHSYDTVVSVFHLCGADDVYSTLLRVAELLKPDGQLLVLEHERATGWRGRVQDAAAPAWRRVTGGCRPNRNVIDVLRQNGFAVTDCDRPTLDAASPLLRHAVSAVAIRKVRNEVAS